MLSLSSWALSKGCTCACVQTVAFLEMLDLPYNLDRAGASSSRAAAAAGALKPANMQPFCCALRYVMHWQQPRKAPVTSEHSCKEQ